MNWSNSGVGVRDDDGGSDTSSVASDADKGEDDDGLDKDADGGDDNESAAAPGDNDGEGLSSKTADFEDWSEGAHRSACHGGAIY